MDIWYVEKQIDCSHIDKSSELRQLRSCWDDLSVCTLDSGTLIIRNVVEILIPPAACQELFCELHSVHIHISDVGMRDWPTNKFF